MVLFALLCVSWVVSLRLSLFSPTCPLSENETPALDLFVLRQRNMMKELVCINVKKAKWHEPQLINNRVSPCDSLTGLLKCRRLFWGHTAHSQKIIIQLTQCNFLKAQTDDRSFKICEDFEIRLHYLHKEELECIFGQTGYWIIDQFHWSWSSWQEELQLGLTFSYSLTHSLAFCHRHRMRFCKYYNA